VIEVTLLFVGVSQELYLLESSMLQLSCSYIILSGFKYVCVCVCVCVCVTFFPTFSVPTKYESVRSTGGRKSCSSALV